MSEALRVVGELTIDDVAIEDENIDWKQPGGGALYAAAGAAMWHPDVALHSAVGQDYPESFLEQIVDVGIDVTSVQRVPGMNSVGLWLLYEAGGFRRQIAKRSGSIFEDLDRVRSAAVGAAQPRGVHIAPQSSIGQELALAQLADVDCVRTMDILLEPEIDKSVYLDGHLFASLNAFMPSLQEVAELWAHQDAAKLAAWLRSVGSDAVTVLKRGAEGTDVVDGGSTYRVATVVRELVDPTGAGDAFCGGFLAGYVATGEPVEAALMGAVSASFVCETRGAVQALERFSMEAAQERLTAARQSIESVS